MNQKLIKLLTEQKKFSLSTFGPKPRLIGVHEHLTKELEELIAQPNDLTEWADCLLLSFDGAMRAGAKPQELVNYLGLAREDIKAAEYRGRWHELRRDVAYMKSLNHLEVWKAWGLIIYKFLVVADKNGFSIEEVLEAAALKLEVNKKRDWPDWKTIPENKAIEHVK